MTKDDLLQVGVRLLGLFYLVRGITDLTSIYWMSRLMEREGLAGFAPDSTVSALLGTGIGAGLFLWAPRLTAWVARRDAGADTDEPDTASAGR